MTLRVRTALMVCCLLVVAVLATTLSLAWSARSSILERETAEGVRLAAHLADAMDFGAEVPNQVDAAIGEQMVTQAVLASHLVALAEEAGHSPEQIARRLRSVAQKTTADEFWVTDSQGHAYIHSLPNVDFSFDPDPKKQPQAHAFWPLLSGKTSRVIQETRPREIDGVAFKYVGVPGADRPRIVQVGSRGTFLESLRASLGLERLVPQMVVTGEIQSLRVVDRKLQTLKYAADPEAVRAGEIREQAELPVSDALIVQKSLRSGEPATRLVGGTLQVASPIHRGSDVWGAALLELSTSPSRAAVQRQAGVAAGVAVAVLVTGLLISLYLARRVTEPLAQLTKAATALESGEFDPEMLRTVAARDDELGRLARVFQKSATEVRAREVKLQQQVQDLKIEIDHARKERQVSEITESDYFKDLQQKVRTLRSRPSEAAG